MVLYIVKYTGFLKQEWPWTKKRGKDNQQTFDTVVMVKITKISKRTLDSLYMKSLLLYSLRCQIKGTKNSNHSNLNNDRNVLTHVK